MRSRGGPMSKKSEKINFDDYVANYDSLMREHLTTPFEEDNAYFAEYKIKVMRDQIEGNSMSILDYGCGIGRSVAYLQKYFPGSHISGFDVSEESVEYARKKYPGCNFYNTPQIEKMTDAYDAIFVGGVFH